MPGKNLPGNRLQDLAEKFLEMIFYRTRQQEEELPQENEEDKNPYLFQIREILEQILDKRRIPYNRFVPVLIDGKDSKHALMTAELLGRDLNRIVILTDNPAYFEDYADNMYEEQGLIAEILRKEPQKIAALSSEEVFGNVILDFEEKGERASDIKFGKKIYIPVFKRKWERAGNLDIAVPIGYNTMTVRESKMVEEQYYPDKFERAFYENE